MPPTGVTSRKRARQYEHIKDSAEKQGRSPARAKQIAAATVNKQRREAGETRGSRKGSGTAGARKSSAKRKSRSTSSRKGSSTSRKTTSRKTTARATAKRKTGSRKTSSRKKR